MGQCISYYPFPSLSAFGSNKHLALDKLKSLLKAQNVRMLVTNDGHYRAITDDGYQAPIYIRRNKESFEAFVDNGTFEFKGKSLS